jgi:hypothetical protein
MLRDMKSIKEKLYTLGTGNTTGGTF